MRQRSFFPYLVVALFALTLAASTGVLLRFGMIYGMPDWAQNFTAVRHAHSHLMYFGWVTLALMALIWSELPELTGRPLPRGVHAQMICTAVFALLSYPAFWPNGYGLTQIGPARLPLGSMMSTLNGLTWFVFIALYLRATAHLPERPLPVQLWDWALALMLMAAGGAIGLVAMVITRADNMFLQQMFLHQFLDLFAVGWFNLALLGIIWAMIWRGARSQAGSGAPEQPRWLPTMSLALLLGPTFLLGMAPALLPAYLFWIAAAANAAAAGLLLYHLAAIWRRRTQLPAFAWFAYAALLVMIASAFALLIPGVWSFSAGGQLRIFYLHDVLLGWVSTLLLVLITRDFVRLPRTVQLGLQTLWGAGVAAMLVALFLLGIAPLTTLSTLHLLQVAAWASVPVAVAALVLLAAAIRQAGQEKRRLTTIQDGLQYYTHRP